MFFMTRTKVISATRVDGHWQIVTEHNGVQATHTARALVNAGGPWVENIVREVARLNTSEGVRLVRGSHIVTKKLFDHDKSYFFQGEDGRITFAIPYETDFTLIGTTDAEHENLTEKPYATDEEQDYLCAFATQYFEKPVTRDDIVWTYSGVRPLYDDGAKSATAATRDYVLSLDDNGAPLLNIFGGKITTYRKLAENAMKKLHPLVGGSAPWTHDAALPGGDFKVTERDQLVADLQSVFPFLTPAWALRLIKGYGTEARDILGDAKEATDLGQDFGATLTEAEVKWLMTREYALRAEDVVWRRSKLGLRLTLDQIATLDTYMAA